MRAISVFSLEAGISTFWCRERIALRMRASMSATGSVSLIFCFSSPPVRSLYRENPRRLASSSLSSCARRPLSRTGPERAAPMLAPFASRNRAYDAPPYHLPRRLRNSRNLAAQRQLPETQPADAELAQVRARASADLAAVVLARRELRLLYVLRLDLAFRRVLHSFCCSCHLASSSWLLASSNPNL